MVDFSAEMLRVGEKEDIKAGLGDLIRWHEADVSRPMRGLTLEASYDIVMANWVFDHAENVEELEEMFASASAYLKQGSRLICVHTSDPRGVFEQGDKYGSSLTNLEEVPGGLKYLVTLYGTEPPVEFGGVSLEVLYNGIFEIYNKFGFEDPRLLPLEDTELVKSDVEFWEECVEHPMLRFVTARKGTKR